MSDEDLPPTHQEWGSRRPDQYPGGAGAEPTQPVPPGPSYGAPSDPYAPPPNPYPQPGTFDELAATSPYGAPAPGYPPGYPGYAGAGQPEHPSATTAMVLGLISLIGIAFCAGLTLVLSPFAWVSGSRAVREIDAQPGRYAGREKANAGRIMGIIGTVLLVLGVLAVVALIGLVVVVGHTSNDPGPSLPSQSGFANS